VRDGIVEANVMMHGIGPKFDGQVGAVKHGHQGIGDGLMRAFTGTVLTGGICTSEFDCVASMLEQINNLPALTEFAPLVKTDIFTGDRLIKTVLGEPLIEKLDRRSFM
jgi:hypothetical protein